jgi:hypothetical protein
MQSSSTKQIGARRLTVLILSLQLVFLVQQWGKNSAPKKIKIFKFD